jgi:L-alanine-DL-glutamate epimerase-like enolase superfamily enzyme
LVEEGPLIVDGHIAIGEKPGLGVTLDEEVAKEAAKESLGFFA